MFLLSLLSLAGHALTLDRAIEDFQAHYQNARKNFPQYRMRAFQNEFTLSREDQLFLKSNLNHQETLPELLFKKIPKGYELESSDLEGKSLTIIEEVDNLLVFSLNGRSLSVRASSSLQELTQQISEALNAQKISSIDLFWEQILPKANAAKLSNTQIALASVIGVAVIYLLAVRPWQEGGDGTRTYSHQRQAARSINPSLPAPIGNERQVRERIIAAARLEIGKSYVWDEAGPESFDCSGFLHYIMINNCPRRFQLPYKIDEVNRNGGSYKHQSDYYRDHLSKKIDCAEAQEADIIFFPKVPGTYPFNHIGFVSDRLRKKFVAAQSESIGVQEQGYGPGSDWGDREAECYENPWIAEGC